MTKNENTKYLLKYGSGRFVQFSLKNRNLGQTHHTQIFDWFFRCVISPLIGRLTQRVSRGSTNPRITVKLGTSMWTFKEVLDPCLKYLDVTDGN